MEGTEAKVSAGRSARRWKTAAENIQSASVKMAGGVFTIGLGCRCSDVM